jgi:uncharacterized membrane protein YdbT with pleckstrin-like domain
MYGIDRLLLPGERTRIVARPHWMALVKALAIRIVQLTLVWLMVRAAHSTAVDAVLNLPFVREIGPGGAPLPLADWAGRIGLYLFLLVIALGGHDVVRWYLCRYVLTDQRILNLSGVVVRQVIDSPLDRIDDLLLVQSVLGAKLDYGDLVVLRAGEAGSYMGMLAEPLRFQQAMHAARTGRSAGPRRSPHSPQPAHP